MLNNKTILITGGTGSFGVAFVKYILSLYLKVKKIIIFSRDEQKQFAMASELPSKKFPISYYLGDVRDKERLFEVTKGVDILIHSAAMKHVPAAEQNPMECVKTNILGSQNVIDACIANNVKQVVALSTDKAASPANVYGASKLLLEKLFTYADSQQPRNGTKFSVVRYGNIFGSKGSVVPFFMKKRSEGVLPITDPSMTRFSITLKESIDLVMFALEKGWGGEVIVPIAPSYKILDVAKAVAPECNYPTVGIRKGEKIHELMVTHEESYDTVRLDHFYIICPSDGKWNRGEYCEKTDAKEVENGFEYHSGKNDKWLSRNQINKLIDLEINLQK